MSKDCAHWQDYSDLEEDFDGGYTCGLCGCPLTVTGTYKDGTPIVVERKTEET